MGNDADRRTLISLARVWLNGWIEKRGSKLPAKKYVEAGSDEDVRGRTALAQLLADNAVPRDILDALAALVAPDENKRGAVIGRDVERTDPNDAVYPDKVHGSRRTISVPHWRSNERKRDALYVGYVLHEIHLRTRIGGASIEQACHDLADEIREHGDYRGSSDRSLKAIWDDYAEWRRAVFK